MSGNLPFGFNPGDSDDSGNGGDGGSGTPSPFGAGGFDPSSMDMAQFGAALQQLMQRSKSAQLCSGPPLACLA